MVRRITLAGIVAATAMSLGQAPPEEQAMLDAFDKALTAMVYTAAGLAVLAIVWAGFVLMAEGASDRQAGRARAAVFTAIAGLVLVLSAKGVALALLNGIVPIP